MTWEQEKRILLETHEESLQRRAKMALRMETALRSDDAALIKLVAQKWVDLELPPESAFVSSEKYREFRKRVEAL